MRSTSAKILLLCAAALWSSRSASAADISFAGVINNDAGSEISRWKTITTPKTLDADANNIYGSLAHLFYTIEFKGNGTSFQFISSDAQVGPFAGYAVVDHPDLEDNVLAGTIQVRTTTNNGVGGANDPMFTFNALAGSPENVRIGIVTDGLNGSQFAPSTIGLRQMNGAMDSEEVVLTAVNNTLDMVFFDIFGIQPGDQFQVFADAGGGGFTTHQIVTFDEILEQSVVPEPTSLFAWSVIAACLTGLAILRKRRCR